ncbi:hypothetical protein CR513_12010, partial [Mucuna pruriens]
MLKIEPHCQQSMARRICPKLSARYYGPFQILKRVSAVAYNLHLPEGSKIHCAMGEHPIDSTLRVDLELDTKPKKVLKSRSIGQFPYFNLENNVAFVLGGINRPKFGRSLK